MINLADVDMRCECGSSRLSSVAHLAVGSVTICAACGRTARVAVVLEPVSWAVVQDVYANRPWDLCAFEWVRRGIKPRPENTRAALARVQATGGKFSRTDRAVNVLFAVFVLFVAYAAVSILAVHP